MKTKSKLRLPADDNIHEMEIVRLCAHDGCNEMVRTPYQTERDYNKAWEETVSDWFCETHRKHTDANTIKTLWVDPIHGDDAYPGKIAEYPFRTLQHALSVCEDGTVIYLLLPSDYLNRKVVVVVAQEVG